MHPVTLNIKPYINAVIQKAVLHSLLSWARTGFGLGGKKREKQQSYKKLACDGQT
jgi:hypothetical protein